MFLSLPLVWFSFYFTEKGVSFENPGFPIVMLTDSDSFNLKKGDILVRPNWSWLPGSFPLAGGQKFGHVAIVTEDMSGNTPDEVLSKTRVIEALFYDQATRRFLFRKDDQIREGKAITAFGNRFKGSRYRLRTNLTSNQTEDLIRFLRNQLDGGYNILSFKKQYTSATENQKKLQNLRQDWQCATLTWEAYFLATGLDIDSNEGWFIYPSDIIASKNFDLPGGRLRF
jgi:hypothetical protein